MARKEQIMFNDITECARSKFNFEFISNVVLQIKKYRPDTELFKLAEGVLWHGGEKSWIFHKTRVKEFEDTGDLKIEI